MNIVLINYRDSIHVVLRMRILYKRTRVNCLYTCKNFNSCTTSVMMAGSSIVVDLSSSLLKETAVLFGITLGFHQKMEESFRRRRKEMKYTVKYAVKYSNTIICALISRYYHYCDTSSQKYRDSDFTTIAQA